MITKNILLIIVICVISFTQARPVSEVMPEGGAGFDPWNKTRWSNWYDQDGKLVEPFEIDVSLTFADKSTPWHFDSSYVKRIIGGLASVFVISENSDISIDGNGITIDARTDADLTRDLYYYYTHKINLDEYSDENCFIFNQTEYSQADDRRSIIHNMTIKGFSRGIACHHDHRRKVDIQNINFIRDIWGIFPRGQNGTVQNCVFEENVMGGFYCEYNSYDWIIRNNTFRDNNTRGVPSYADIVIDACRDYLVSGNSFLPAAYYTRPYHTAISLYRNRGENLDVRELAPRDNTITGNTFENYHIAIDFAPRQANFSNNDNSDETRCYTMDNAVTDNQFINCKIGILNRSNFNSISGNTFSDTEIDMALLNMFYAVHHNTIDQPGDNLWLWSTSSDYTAYASYLGYTNQSGSYIPKSEKFFHIICPGDIPVIHNNAGVEFIIADSLVIPEQSDINSDMNTDGKDLKLLKNNWLSAPANIPFNPQTTDIKADGKVDLNDYAVLAEEWYRKNPRLDFYSVNPKKPIDIAVGDMAVFEAGDEIAVIWDQPVSNISNVDYYTIAIFDQRGNELDRCGRSERRWSKIAVGNFLPDGGWIKEDANFEIAAVSSEPDQHGKYPVYIFHKGFRLPSAVLLEDNTSPITALTAGNFTTGTDDYDEIAVKVSGSTEIKCLKPSDPTWQASVTGVADDIIDIAAGEFDGRASQDEIAAVTYSPGPVLIYKIRIDGTYKTCADYGKKWQNIAVGSFDTQTAKENIVLTEAVTDENQTLGCWQFEENSGQYTYPSLGGPTMRLGSSSSTWQDPEWSTDGYSGNCLHYISADGRPDGNIDLIRPEPTEDLSGFNTDTFTVQAWIKLDSIPENTFDYYNPYMIMSFGGKDGENLNKDVYFLRVTQRSEGVGMLNGYYYSEDGTGHSFSHPTDLVTGQWYHVAFAHDGSSDTNNTSIWVNGVEQTFSKADHPRTDLQITGESLVIGASWVRSRGFNGLIDEVKISNVKLKTQDLQANTLSGPQKLYFFTDADNTPFRELELDVINSTPIAISAGRLYADPQMDMYLRTDGISKQQFYTDYQLWKDSIAILTKTPGAISTAAYWIGVNPQDQNQSSYRLVPIMR
jgi:hypothetical protein